MSQSTNGKGILLVCLTLFIAYAVMTAVSFFVPAIIRVLLLVVIIILLCSEYGLDSFLGVLWKLVPVYIIAIINIIQIFSEGPDQLIAAIYDLSSYILISSVYLLIIKSHSFSFAKPLLKIVLIIYILTIVTTIYGNYLYPEASRRMATGMEGELALYNSFRAMNIGGFGFVYEIVLPLSLLPFVFKQNIISKSKAVMLYLLVLYCIYSTQFTFALIITAGFGTLFFIGSLRNTKKLVLNLTVIGVVLVMILPVLLQFLASSLSSDIMSDRFGDMGNLMAGGEVSEQSDVGARQFHYMESINAFLSSPLTGTGSRGGGHSFVLDNMAKYGLFGLIAIIIMLRSIFKIYIKPYKSSLFYPYLLIGYLAYLFMVVFNTSPLYMSVTFLLPLISYVIINDKSYNQLLK